MFSSIRVHHQILGLFIALSFIGYIFATASIPSVLRAGLGETGFMVLVVTSVASAGLLMSGTVQHRYGLVIFPLYFVVIALIHMCFNGSFTALPYYISIPLLALYHQYRNRLPRLSARKILLPLYVTMLIVLLIEPYSSGMGLFYAIVDVWTYGTVDSVSLYRAIYILAIFGIVLSEFTHRIPQGRLTAQLLTIPYCMHAWFFLVYIVTSDSPQWGLVPFLVLVPMLWLHAMTEYDYG